MNRKLLSAAALALILALTLPALVSCADRGDVVVSVGNVEVDEAMYTFFMSSYKRSFLTAYEGSGAADTESFWSTVRDDGMTMEEYFNAVALENVKKYAAAAWMFDYMDRQFTNDMKKRVNNNIDDIIINEFDGDEDAFNDHLRSLGIDRDVLYDVYVLDEKQDYMYEYLYGPSGAIEVPDSDKLKYVQDNYAHIEHIYVNNVFTYETDENGEYVYDEDGYGIEVPLSDDEITAANKKIKAIEDGIADNEDFHELWLDYSEDHLYADGYYLLPTTPYIKEIVDTSFEMDVGEIRKLQTSNGVHFIKRLPIEGTPWSYDTNDDFFDGFDDELHSYLFAVMVGEYAEDAVINDEAVARHSIKDAVESPYI